jgi:hypothetical protein
MDARSELRLREEALRTATGGKVGLTRYSPGDGKTRYALGLSSVGDGLLHDYFGDSRIMSALGAAEALVMLNAFLAGITYARNMG